jgi:hypothetical protein
MLHVERAAATQNRLGVGETRIVDRRMRRTIHW